MSSVKSGLVFFLRPHPELLREDGVRAGVQWEEVVRIDGMVKLMLEMFGIPYIPVDCLSMQERVRLLQRVFSLAGLESIEAQARGIEAQARVIDGVVVRGEHGRREGNGAGAHTDASLVR